MTKQKTKASIKLFVYKQIVVNMLRDIIRLGHDKRSQIDVSLNNIDILIIHGRQSHWTSV